MRHRLNLGARSQILWVMSSLALLLSGCLIEGSESIAPQGGVFDAMMVDAESTICQVTPSATEIDFASQIRPIFEGKGCVTCHSNASGFDINMLPDSIPNGAVAGGPLITPCQPSQSLFFQKISPTGDCASPYGGKMPQGSDGLSTEETGLIQQWIAEGARATFDASACP